MLLGVGLPLIFIPIMTASYDGIAQSNDVVDRGLVLVGDVGDFGPAARIRCGSTAPAAVPPRAPP
jgi:hypothetical protein